LNTIFRLVLNDLKRDWKRPWATLLFASLPLVLSVLIGSIFGGRGSSGPMPTIRVAVLDEDKDLLARMLRSLQPQGDNANHLRLSFVESRAEGLRLLEKSRVSAFVVLPKEMTADLLNGKTNAIELFENPAEQVLPRVVRQGVSLLALGSSAIAETLGGPLRDIRAMVQSNQFPAELAISQVSTTSVHRLTGYRTYIFPPLVQFETVSAADYHPLSTNGPAAPSTP
jgi:hypothetical protein